MRQPLLTFSHALLAVISLCPSGRPPLLAQSSGSSLSGTVRAADTGKPVASAVVAAGTRRTVTDSVGRFVLPGAPGGRVQLSVRRIGFARLDTVIVLSAGPRARVDMVLQPDWLIAARRTEAEAEAADAAAGRVDSSALGLVGARAVVASPLTFDLFGRRLLAAAVQGRHSDSNTVLSPVSAGLALSLAALGARGRTEAELAGVLGTTGLDRASLVQGGTALLESARGRTDVQLEIASAVWVDSAARLTPGFASSAARWSAAAGTLRLPSPEAFDVINRWADSVTHGRISRILAEPLADTTVLFLANAVYFKGRWLDPFEKSATGLHDFTLASGHRVSVPMMEQYGWLAYRREPGYQVARLPYRGGRVAMYVILPDSGTAPAALEQRFAAHGWPPSLLERDKGHVHLVLPKLHVEQTHDLRPLLATLGASVALDCRRADFQDLALEKASGAPMSLCIGKAAQTVYLDVDEEGTEAAAVSGLEMVGPTGVMAQSQFVVDRPFLFVLRDERSGASLFVARIGRPE